MHRLSKFIERMEDEVEKKAGSWLARNKEKLPRYIFHALVGGYFYGMFLNSLHLGIESVFGPDNVRIVSIWVFNPLKNWIRIFTPFGLMATAFFLLMICLISKKGYHWLSGYHYTHDERGFDILPDGTHGSSGFLKEKEMREFLELGSATEIQGMMLGKLKKSTDEPDKYATYVAHRMVPGDNNNLLCIGAPGSGKSRGFIIPFLMGCATRGESAIITDPKGELFEKLAPFFEEQGYYVKVINFLDMEHSDGWNCLYGLDQNPDLVETVANVIIQNTSGPNEADDFWSRAEQNLLLALLYYVVNKRDSSGNLLPIQQRGLGDVYRILSTESINDINYILASLPPDHPAKGPHGLFLKARENLWGNIIIGLGNRLGLFQNKLVDEITRNHDVDLTLPGKKKCAYFVIISAQDSAYRFLSSLFFSLAMPILSNLASQQPDKRLPVMVNFCMDEYCNVGYMESVSDALNTVRGFNIACQVVVQSLSQWKEKYPGSMWENHLGAFDQTLYMGCNDLTTAEYISKKIGKVTISVTNNQKPLTPLFSPLYTTVRPYSQTRSNTQRDLMQPDEILRLDRRKCLVMFNGHHPALLDKLVPEELPGYGDIKGCRVVDYIPAWKKRKASDVHPADVPPPPPKEEKKKAASPGMVEQPLHIVRGEEREEDPHAQ